MKNATIINRDTKEITARSVNFGTEDCNFSIIVKYTNPASELRMLSKSYFRFQFVDSWSFKVHWPDAVEYIHALTPPTQIKIPKAWKYPIDLLKISARTGARKTPELFSNNAWRMIEFLHASKSPSNQKIYINPAIKM